MFFFFFFSNITLSGLIDLNTELKCVFNLILYDAKCLYCIIQNKSVGQLIMQCLDRYSGRFQIDL